MFFCSCLDLGENLEQVSPAADREPWHWRERERWKAPTGRWKLEECRFSLRLVSFRIINQWSQRVPCPGPHFSISHTSTCVRQAQTSASPQRGSWFRSQHSWFSPIWTTLMWELVGSLPCHFGARPDPVTYTLSDRGQVGEPLRLRILRQQNLPQIVVGIHEITYLTCLGECWDLAEAQPMSVTSFCLSVFINSSTMVLVAHVAREKVPSSGAYFVWWWKKGKQGVMNWHRHLLEWQGSALTVAGRRDILGVVETGNLWTIPQAPHLQTEVEIQLFSLIPSAIGLEFLRNSEMTCVPL